jgi:hypothetical protein
MTRLTTLSAMKKRMLTGIVVAALTAVTGLQVTGLAAQAERLWSVVVHFEYENGFEFDYVLGTGLSTPEMTEMLQDCGRSHWTGSVVRYHCYPIAE